MEHATAKCPCEHTTWVSVPSPLLPSILPSIHPSILSPSLYSLPLSHSLPLLPPPLACRSGELSVVLSHLSTHTSYLNSTVTYLRNHLNSNPHLIDPKQVHYACTIQPHTASDPAVLTGMWAWLEAGLQNDDFCCRRMRRQEKC